MAVPALSWAKTCYFFVSFSLTVAQLTPSFRLPAAGTASACNCKSQRNQHSRKGFHISKNTTH